MTSPPHVVVDSIAAPRVDAPAHRWLQALRREPANVEIRPVVLPHAQSAALGATVGPDPASGSAWASIVRLLAQTAWQECERGQFVLRGVTLL